MNYLIIVLFLYCCNSLGMEEGEKKMELSQLTFSEIKNGFFEEIKKSKLKKLGLSLGSSILSFGLTALVNKKYQITKKQRMVGAVSFFLFPLSSQAAAYYYFGKHPELKTFENSFLFREQYKDVLKQREEKSQTDDNDDNDVFQNDRSNSSNIYYNNKDREKKSAPKTNKNSKEKENTDKKYSSPNYERFGFSNFYYNSYDNNYNKNYNNYNTDYSKNNYQSFNTSKPKISNQTQFKLELPPLPDEGIPGNEQGHLNKRKNDEKITPKF